MLTFKESYDAVVETPKEQEGSLKLSGRFHWVIENPDGTIEAEGDIENLVVNVGLTHALATELGAGSQITTWYIGLIEGTTYTGFAAGDTMASHSGWTENTNYSEGTRQTWIPGAPSTPTITNGSPAIFTCNTNGTQLKGFFVASVNTKGGTTGTLWSEGAFAGGTQTLNSGQLLKATYTVNAASS